MVDILSLKDKKDELVIIPTDLAVIATPYGVGSIPSKISTGVNGALIPLPTGWKSAGEIDQKSGAKITPDLKTAEVMGYGSLGPRRVVKTEESVTVSFTAQESRNINLGMFWGKDLSAVVEDVNGEWQAKKSYANSLDFFSLILIAQDQNEFGPVFPYWIFPKVAVTKTEAISLGTDAALMYPLTFTAFEDSVYGGYCGFGSAGAGQAATNDAAGFGAGS